MPPYRGAVPQRWVRALAAALAAGRAAGVVDRRQQRPTAAAVRGGTAEAKDRDALLAANAALAAAAPATSTGDEQLRRSSRPIVLEVSSEGELAELLESASPSSSSGRQVMRAEPSTVSVVGGPRRSRLLTTGNPRDEEGGAGAGAPTTGGGGGAALLDFGGRLWSWLHQGEHETVVPQGRDCRWGQWSPWESCSCNSGWRQRTRTVAISRVEPGAHCSGNSTGWGICCCPGQCCSEWSEWRGECQQTCPRGRKTRTREPRSGRVCNHNSEALNCPGASCAVNCAWNPWSEWAGCDATCGGGERTRTRTIARQAQFGGAVCQGGTTDRAHCPGQPCPEDCTWQSWDDWSSCTRSCGGGLRERGREKATERQYGGRACVGNARGSERCNAAACPQNCRWSLWSNWSPCSLTCGNGTSTRSRGIAVQAGPNGASCQGGNLETRRCNAQLCPVACAWSTWDNWTPCPVTCGAGEARRTRVVAVQAKHNGVACTGNSTEVGTCSRPPCPTAAPAVQPRKQPPPAAPAAKLGPGQPPPAGQIAAPLPKAGPAAKAAPATATAGGAPAAATTAVPGLL